jgi:hypothetical protein
MVLDEDIRQLLNQKIEEAINYIPSIKNIFLNPNFNIKISVSNDTDFLLGAVLSQTLNQFAFSFFEKYRRIMTSEEATEANAILFGKAPEIKKIIMEKAGM